MSYTTINACARDYPFFCRVTACAADEGNSEPEEVARSVIWAIASEDDIESAYASALASENPNPGGDESVITDQMILSSFQANWPLPTE